MLYEELLPLCQKMPDCIGSHGFLIQPSRWTIKQLKRNLLVALYSPAEDMLAAPAFRAFQQRFPEVAEYVLSLKANDYKALAHQLQQMESSIIIHGVCADLMRSYPHVPLLTIHDELIIAEQYAELAKELLHSHFGKYGLVPYIRQEALNANPN
jgi:hypothetical protein